MEKNANYALVGLSSLILFVGLVIFVVWLARVSFSQEYDLYDIVFDGPVRGLNQGGEVHFNGIKVGEVTKIALDRTNPSRVIARARVTSDVPIRIDSYATLEPQGITGVNYVQITAGTPSKPLLKDVQKAKCQSLGLNACIPILKSQRSALSDLLEGGGTVLTRTIEALDRVNRVLSDKNIQSFSATLADAQAVGDELKEKKAIVDDAQKLIQDLDQATRHADGILTDAQGAFDSDGKRSLKNIADAADEAKKAATSLRVMVDKLQGPTSDFANNGLPQITSALFELQRAAQSLERLVNEIQKSPTGALGKAPAEEVKVKP
ncbi:MlaD family protein [Phenylobacterium sp.]|jgi:phospholipid/cholesterol/gamma-HCH transport system substrate-binding protein|uniref:MlaD family protein n=1 Tax=Phenylobacterium sp. TaxID=1871053 RepID=UPI002F418D54